MPALIDVVIPALNEAASIGRVVGAVPRPPVRTVYVVDNGSRDATAAVARAAGARVIGEPRRGYGAACLAGVRALPADTEIVVFLDADGADDPTLLPELVRPIVAEMADLVVGARVGAGVERGALSVQQRIGNAIAAKWLRARFGLPATDLGPFRAVRRACLDALMMSDLDYGWTVEMQIKAARRGLRYAEVAVPYRVRMGRSKISGTLRGVLGAAIKILGLLAWHDLRQRCVLPSTMTPGTAPRSSSPASSP
jgi:glycosyltransferase involved in cell wall biosynthesis